MFPDTTDVALHSGVGSERRQGLVQFVCAASVFFLLSRREAFTRAKISQSWCGQVPESLGPIESLPRLLHSVRRGHDHFC